MMVFIQQREINEEERNKQIAKQANEMKARYGEQIDVAAVKAIDADEFFVSI